MKFLNVLALFSWLLAPVAQAQTPLTIASISDSQRITQGQSVTLSVSVDGTLPLNYQWNIGGTPIAGATSSTFTIPAVTLADIGSYTVTATNTDGTVTSGPILLEVTRAVVPGIVRQPSDLSCTVGDTATLSVFSSGSSPLTYVWKKSGVTIATTSDPTYSWNGAQATDSGTYTVTVSNIAGSITSSPFRVTVSPLTAPRFSTTPANQIVSAGNSFSFNVVVTGAGLATYQWYKDGSAIPGATSSSYGRSNAVVADSGAYYVVATNSLGSTISPSGTLTVMPAVVPPLPTGAPSGVTITNGPIFVEAGANLSLTSNVNDGALPLSYQWLKDGVEIAGATSASYLVASVSGDAVGWYSVVVSNNLGSVSSAASLVSTYNAQSPIITTNPTSMVAYSGLPFSLSVGVFGNDATQYQWLKDGVAIPDATSSSLTPTLHALASDAGTYTVVVSNAKGSVTSQPAKVTVLGITAPTISSQPQDVTVVPGHTFNLVVDAIGSPPPTYQWLKDGVAIPGATMSGYGVGSASANDEGVYTVVASSGAGSVTSRGATVTVLPVSEPVITAQPASASLLVNDYFDGLYVTLAKSQSDTFQWYRNGSPIAGATDSKYIISAAQPVLAGTYHVVVINVAGSTTSQDATITVDLSTARPVITYASGGCLVLGGNPASVSAVSIQTAPSLASYSIAWKKDGVLVPNATSSSIVFSNFNITKVGTYTAEVTVGSTTAVSPPMVVDILNKNMAPVIRNQPLPADGVVGRYASFQVSAEGESPLSYQWQKDGVALPGATSLLCELPGLTSASAGAYSVIVSNRVGSVTSQAATLTVTTPSTTVAPPVLAGQPTSQSIALGTPGVFWLSVSLFNYDPNGSYSYQWYKDGALMPELSGSAVAIPVPTTAGTNRYKVIVTNSGGSVTSDEAIVAIAAITGPTITIQPVDQISHVGAGATLTISATGASTVSYQWRKNGVPIAGATSATLAWQDLQISDAGKYTVVVTDLEGTISSAPAVLTLAPIITTQPVAQFWGIGDKATFQVIAPAAPDPTYQWLKNGISIPGATLSTYALSSLAKSDAGSYSVVVSNVGGTVTSNAVALKVYDHTPWLPIFTTQPSGGGYAPGLTVTLSTVVSAYPEATLQWYKQGVAIAGATDATLSLGKISPAIAGDYYLVATNDLGSTQSATATVSQIPSPYAGVYFGTSSTSNGHWALRVNADGTAKLLAYIPDRHSAIFADTIIHPDGTFSITGTEIVAAAERTVRAVGESSRVAAAAGDYTLSGQINGTAVSAQLGEFGISLTGAADASTAVGAARIYEAKALGTASGTIYAIVASGGQAVVVTIATSGVEGAPGVVDSTGQLSTTMSGGDQLVLNVGTSQESLTATVTGSTAAVNFAGRSDTVRSWKRLVNISSRANSGTGNNVAIGGFGVAGGGTKRLLLRAVGPTLNSQGIPVGEQMVDPTIEVHDALNGNAVIASADNWSDGTDATQLASLASQVGAATLSGGDNKSAAAILTVPAGVYTFIAAGKNQTTGIVLVEVYDADSADSAATLVNISTRAYCGAGDSVAIGGFGVSGNAPKKVLVRAVGPTLTTQGLTANEVLSDPTIEVHDALHTNAVIATNDNWMDNANTAQLAATGARVGATPLATADLTSSALLLTLPPGVYSFVVRGKGSASGIVLIEVYDVD